MAELERQLVEAGYSVISWGAIQQMVIHEERVTPLEAAERLGADVLFEVNSLERSSPDAGHEEMWKRTFYESDEYGRKGDLASVPEQRAQALEKGMAAVERGAQVRPAIGVTVNVTAVLVASGEAIWFYSATFADPAETHLQTQSRLFECHEDALWKCLPRVAEPLPEDDLPDEPMKAPSRSGSRGSLRASGRSVASIYYEQIRRAVRDVVEEFSRRRP